MKKRILQSLFVFMMIISTVACEKNTQEEPKPEETQKISAEEIYQKYLDSKDYEEEDFGGLSPIKYTFLDVTEDDIPELFITADDKAENNSHYTLVLTIENESVKKVGMIHSTTGILYTPSYSTHIAYLQNSTNSNIYVVKIDDNNEFKKLYDVYFTNNHYHLTDYEQNIDKDCTTDEASNILDRYLGWYLKYDYNIDGTPKDNSAINNTNYLKIGNYTTQYGTYIGKEGSTGEKLTIKSDGTAILYANFGNNETEREYTYKIEEFDFAQDVSQSHIQKAIVFYNDDNTIGFALYPNENNVLVDGGIGLFELN